MSQEDTMDKDPFLLWQNRKKHIYINKRSYEIPRQWIPGSRHAPQKTTGIPVLPSTISNLCLVSRYFNMTAMNLWKPFYEIHIKKSPYKRKYPTTFYRNKVYDLIRKYIDSVIKYTEGRKGYYSKMNSIKSNNSARYLELIKSSIVNGHIDNENMIYRVDDLLWLDYDFSGGVTNPRGEGIIRTISLDLHYERLIAYRRKAKRECDDYELKVVQHSGYIFYMNQRRDRLR
jgi:hypothetical protein